MFPPFLKKTKNSKKIKKKIALMHLFILFSSFSIFQGVNCGNIKWIYLV